MINTSTKISQFLPRTFSKDFYMKMFRNSGQFKMKDIKGQKFGLLTALFAVKQDPRGGGYYWRCQCDCGNFSDVLVGHLSSGSTTKCNSNIHKKGVNRKHGLRNHPLYRIWRGIKYRCLNPSCHNYKDYGGRGIKICDRWINSVENFYNDMNPTYSLGMHIDRIDNNGNYEPSNCRWVTSLKNQNNKRTNMYITLDGRTHTPAEWSRELGIKANTIQNRKRKGWNDFECLFGLSNT